MDAPDKTFDNRGEQVAGASPVVGRLRFRVLGPLEVMAVDRGPTGSGSLDRRLGELGPPKQRALLAILLLHAGEILSVERLTELVWGGSPPRTAAHSIQIYVSALRKFLEPAAGVPVILTRHPGYLFEAEPESIDANRFGRLIQDGTNALKLGDRRSAKAALRAALDLWRGQPLADFAYEEFAQADIRRLQDFRLNAIEGLSEIELSEGSAQEVLPLLETSIGEDPLRERLRELQMLGLYRAGRHPDALRVYQDFRQLLADELGLDPSPSLQQLQERMLLHDPSLGPESAEVVTGTVVRNPYKGLRPFVEEDAEDFFGRKQLVRQLLESLAKGAPLLAVVGPSGSGKSSVVAAGLIPALRSGEIAGSHEWTIVRMQPGTNPSEKMRAAVPEASRRVLIVIDQFEELFTLAGEATRERFLSELVAATRGPVHIVICLRGDFYDRPLMHPEFAEIFGPGVVNVLPMTPSEIEGAVVEPARQAGVDVEPALLAEMIADTAHQSGALPLLQYALTELFEQRAGGPLTLESYRALGGLHGALLRRSEEVFSHLDPERQGVAVQLFLRLVRLEEAGRPIRRRLPISDLTALNFDPVWLSDVLESFGRHRLLSFDRDPLSGKATVEVAHEALLSEWKRLAGWIDEHRVDLQRQEALATAAREWEAAGRDPDFLLTGSRLSEQETWSRDTVLRLTTSEQAFLDAGLERRRDQEAQEAVRLQRQRRLEKRARARLVALVAVLTLLAAATTYGILARPGSRIPDLVVAFGGTGDAAVNDLIARGLDRATSEFGLTAETVEANFGRPGQEEEEIRRLAEEGVELIVVAQLCVDEFADDYPDTWFIGLVCEGDRPNVSSWSFPFQQGSYLAGAAAAMKSRSHQLGFVGGGDVPVIWAFHAGFEAGAKDVDPDVKVLHAYLDPLDASGFDSPNLARRTASRMYSNGADVIFHAAARSGIGVFEAALDASTSERRLWAIGVDADQYEAIVANHVSGLNEQRARALQPHILTSMVVRYDRALYELLSDYVQGSLEPGVREFDLANGGLDLAYSGGFIEDIRPTLEELRQSIVAGDIEVPSVTCARKEQGKKFGLRPPTDCP